MTTGGQKCRLNRDIVAGQIAVTGQVLVVGVGEGGDEVRRQNQGHKHGAGDKAVQHGSLQCPAGAHGSIRTQPASTSATAIAHTTRRGGHATSVSQGGLHQDSSVPIAPWHLWGYHLGMRPWIELSPMQLGRRLVVGAIGVFLGALLLVLLPMDEGAHPYRPTMFICSLAVIWLGAAFSRRAVRVLRRGVLDGRWEDLDIEPLRKFMCIPGLEEISTFCILICFGAAVFSHGLWHWSRFLLPFALPLWNLPNLGKTVTVPEVTETKLAEPHVYTPLRSDHWGQQ